MSTPRTVEGQATMFKRRQKHAAERPEGSRPGEIDRRRLMRLGGRAAVGAAGAAVVGLADGSVAGAAGPSLGLGTADDTASSARSGVVSMVGSRQTVSVPGGLTRSSRVLATVNADPDRYGFFPVVAAAPDPATGTIKIMTNQSYAGQEPPIQVAWFVFD